MCVCHNELSKSRVETQHVIKLRPQHETKLQISREVRDFGEFVRVENSYDYRLLQKNSREVVVGVERFDLLLHYDLPIKILLCNIKYFYQGLYEYYDLSYLKK